MPAHAGIWPLPSRTICVEVRPLVGTQQLEVRRRAGRHQPFAMTLRTMLRVDLPAGIDCGLGSSRRDMGKHGGADEEADAQDIMHVNGCSCMADPLDGEALVRLGTRA